MTSYLWVALGGAIGAAGRYGVGMALLNVTKAFPFATLIVNIVGSFFLGLLVMSQQHQQLSDNHWLLFGVGLLGAFTTFSAFSLEVVMLANQGDWLKAGLHVLLNVVLCVGAVLLAMAVYPTPQSA